jgi:hypothetical protein
MKTYQYECLVVGAYNVAAAWHKTKEGLYYVSIDLHPFGSCYRATVDDYGTLVPVYRYMF